MTNLTVINTGGTFSKVYDPTKGELEISEDLVSMIKEINNVTYLDRNINFDIYGIIGKDSLYMTDEDRGDLTNFINKMGSKKIVIIHGTDTIDMTANFLEAFVDESKTIVLTGSMVPYSIDPREAISNYIQAVKDSLTLEPGVYISLHGVTGSVGKVYKDRSLLKYKDYYFTTR